MFCPFNVLPTLVLSILQFWRISQIIHATYILRCTCTTCAKLQLGLSFVTAMQMEHPSIHSLSSIQISLQKSKFQRPSKTGSRPHRFCFRRLLCRLPMQIRATAPPVPTITTSESTLEFSRYVAQEARQALDPLYKQARQRCQCK